MGCSPSLEGSGYISGGPTNTNQSHPKKNDTYSSFYNGYHNQTSPSNEDSLQSRQDKITMDHMTLYPNQPPGIGSYNHGVATLNPPQAPSHITPSRTKSKPKNPKSTTRRLHKPTEPAFKTATRPHPNKHLPHTHLNSKTSAKPAAKSANFEVSLPNACPSPTEDAHLMGQRKASVPLIKDQAEFWTCEEMKSEEAEPEEEAEEPHPDHELILGVTEDYVVFKERLENMLEGNLYEDPDFPADTSSLFLDAERNKDIVWKRPSEICDEPCMFVDGTSREDVIQGILSDCWFLAACAGIAQHKDLVRRVSYIGAIHFKFWRFGRWVDVVIDDRLPTKNNRLVFASSSEKNEFWPALMEKAYAKLNGTYQGLSGGMAADAFVDLTGGLSEVFLFTQESVSADFYALLYKGVKTCAFLACSKKNSDFQNVTADESGIVPGHSYTITDSQVVHLNKKKKQEKKKKSKEVIAKLLRVRNPWGNSTEWTGDWSDNSSMWKKLEKEERERLNPKRKDDGEFWMSFEDFCKKFNSVIMCTLGPDFDGDGKADIDESGGGFHVYDMRGHWIKSVSAGGCSNYDTFYTNPQFSFILLQPDDFHSTDSDEKRGKCSIIIALIQEYRRCKKNLAPKRQQIGFRIYETDDPNHPHSRQQLQDTSEVGRSGSFINYRQVYRRFTLAPGSYIIIPSTFNPNIPGTFMMRVFTEKRAVCKALGSYVEI
ncbi:calpain-9-like [Acanthaster planci]|uniref:Calpain-9-like n=1 Tax=Acanthaster planci TaxID=133434 RepID=A0A8B7YB15_ACAPL|nr:calpain-9-like [Acanthaster planci]